MRGSLACPRQAGEQYFIGVGFGLVSSAAMPVSLSSDPARSSRSRRPHDKQYSSGIPDGRGGGASREGRDPPRWTRVVIVTVLT